MRSQLATNIRFALLFYRRNRLLLAIGIVFLTIALLYIGMSLLFDSTNRRFDLIKAVFEQLRQYTSFFTASLALVFVSVHVRGKTIKTIVTKPCPPEIWLGGGIAAAVVICATLNLANLLLSTILSLAFGFPLQPGFAFLSIESFATAIIVMSTLMLLAMALHPAVAVLILVIFSESAFYWIRFGLLSAIRDTGGNPLLPFLEKLTYAIYMIVPMYSPFAEATREAGRSMRVTAGDWKYSVYHLAYALCVGALCYLLSLQLLRRKALV